MTAGRLTTYLSDFGSGSHNEAVVTLNLFDKFLLGQFGLLDGLDAILLEQLDAFGIDFIADQNALQFRRHLRTKISPKFDSAKKWHEKM